MSAGIILGNIFSLFAAATLAASAVIRRRETIYMLGFAECLLLIISQLFFGEPAGAVILLFSAVRNFFLWREQYTFRRAFAIFFVTLVFGILFAGGVLSLLPLIATLIFTVTSYLAKSFVPLKISISVNMLFWIIYSFLIFDFATAITNTISLILNIVSLIKYKIKRHPDTASEA